ncbi:GtrA family protein [Actinomyces sp. zg-332]|uniref:GtrA family protein n=1 Tax=Actinomyces sp. zg-332 TaxID=2708340 RepID=UPI001420A03B|nr:GtrA family protein [Actinomyces sp. zg-332]QPK93868.1 GtrA family protein [Actinomyces sp. zg-332]
MPDNLQKAQLVTLFKYLFFGGSAFVIDFSTLYFFKSILGLSAWSSAIIAFAVSTVYAYFTQMRFTFSHRMQSVAPIIKYAILLLVNMGFTAIVVQFFEVYWQAYMLGKVFATACVTLWNFPIMKHLIFPKNMD